jgi:hypothetical protein
MKQHSKKNHLWKGILFALVFSMISSGLYAQQKKVSSPKTAWVLLKTQANVSLYYQSKKCHDETVILVRIVNANAHNGLVSWSLWGEEMVNQYAVVAHDDIAGSCPNALQKDSNFDLVAYIPAHKSIKDLSANFKID